MKNSKTKLFAGSIYLLAVICAVMIVIGLVAPTPLAINFLMYLGSFISIGFVGVTLYLSGS